MPCPILSPLHLSQWEEGEAALPHQGQSGLEKWSADHRMGLHYCSDPSYKLVSTPDQRMGGHIYEDLMSLDEAWRMQGRQQVTGRQGVQQLGRQDTRTGDSVRSILPRILKIFISKLVVDKPGCQALSLCQYSQQCINSILKFPILPYSASWEPLRGHWQ